MQVPRPLVGKIRALTQLHSLTANSQSCILLKILIPAGQMVNNCSVVGCTNYVGKKKFSVSTVFVDLTKRDVKDGCMVAVHGKD